MSDSIIPNANRSKVSDWGGLSPIAGAVCGLLVWIVSEQLGLLDLLPMLRKKSAWLALILVLIGAGLGLFPHKAVLLRRVLLCGGITLGILWFVVCLTPLSLWMSKPTLMAMQPRRADAIVVLSSSMQADGDWTDIGLTRLLHGLELARGGYAPVVVTTDVASQRAQVKGAARRLIDALRLPLRLESVGPVVDTHDEALAVAKLATARKWKTVLLVTSPSHSRRAWLVFRKTGLNVISAPAQETSYNFQNPQNFKDRLSAFKAALREITGLQIYRWRGWV